MFALTLCDTALISFCVCAAAVLIAVLLRHRFSVMISTQHNENEQMTMKNVLPVGRGQTVDHIINGDDSQFKDNDIVSGNLVDQSITSKEEEHTLFHSFANYYESHLVSELHFENVYIPEEDFVGRVSPKTSILASKNWKEAGKMLIIVNNGYGAVIGVFSRTLCIEEGITKGSALLYIQKALHEGYSVLLLRPNTNSKLLKLNGATSKVPIFGSESPEAHVLYVLENIIPQVTALISISFLAYGNGANLCKEMICRQLVRQQHALMLGENVGSPTIRALVSIEASRIIDNDDPADLRNFISNIAVNFEQSKLFKFGENVTMRRKELGCVSFSLGLPQGHTDIVNTGHSASLALDLTFAYFNLAETDPRPAFSFTPVMRNCNGASSSLAASFGSVFNKLSTSYDRSCASVTVVDASANVAYSKNRSIGKRGINLFKCLFAKVALSSSQSTSSLSIWRVPDLNDETVTKATEAASFEPKDSPHIPFEPEMSHLSSAKGSPCLADFDLLKVVGKGAFGKVLLVRKRSFSGDATTGRFYAMKILRKSAIIKQRLVEHTKSERSILCELRHPFIVRLRFAFQTSDKLYLVTDYYSGGNLYFHLRNGRPRVFTEKRACFYAAEIALALDHLHSKMILYRDLKLDNILLDREGHIALTDFGLSKQHVDETGGASTFCGTAEYIAPELLMRARDKYSKGVDWWAFGVLLYEMLAGRTPFYDVRRDVMFSRICRIDVKYSSFFSPRAIMCISALLKEESERLGSGPCGGNDVMRCAFFSDIDFEALYNRSTAPPFVPFNEADAEVDTRYVWKSCLDDVLSDGPTPASSPRNPGAGEETAAIGANADARGEQGIFKSNKHGRESLFGSFSYQEEEEEFTVSV